MSREAGISHPLALAFVLCAIAAPAHAQGGLFGLLFDRPAAPPAPYYAPQPLEMTVRGHKRKTVPVARRKEPAAQEHSHARLQQPLDAASDHEWFLKDPTLRRGDIIVLSNRVVVFTGGRGQARMADFTDLFGSAIVPKADREKVRKITEAPREALVRYQIVPAAVKAAERSGLLAKDTPQP